MRKKSDEKRMLKIRSEAKDCTAAEKGLINQKEANKQRKTDSTRKIDTMKFNFFTCFFPLPVVRSYWRGLICLICFINYP
jgi:hypothetical protein